MDLLAERFPNTAVDAPSRAASTRILIVDDNPAKLKALTAGLQGVDVEIVTATSGQEALRQLLTQEFAAVLLDVNMPVMDGFETATLIRSRPRSEHLPILFITSERLDEDSLCRGYSLGAVDYLMSPVRPEILRAKVAAFADLHRLRLESCLQAEELRCKNVVLQESAKLLEELQRVARMGRFHWEIASGRWRCDAELGELLGIDFSVAHTPEGWAALLHPEDRTRVMDNLSEAVLVEHRGIDQEFRLCGSGTGTEYWMHLRGRLTFDGHLRPQWLIGTLQDINAYKQNELQIRQEAAQSRLLFESNADGLVVVDPEGIIQLANPAAGVFLGSTPEALKGQPLGVPVTAGGMADLNVTIHGAEKSLSMTTANIGWSDQPSYLVSLRDMTAQRNIEVALQQAKLAAIAASHAKSEFLANMSHEIRTPLNAILGLTQLLQRHALTPEQHELLHKISDAGTSLVDIINDILDFSKIEAGQLKIESHPFVLTTLLSQVESLIMVAAQAKALSFSIADTSGLVGELIGDPLRFKQVLLNLLHNATKFTTQGRVELRIIPQDLTDTTVRLRCEVVDTGIGITPEALARLFQPFAQADCSTTRRFGGTGLGLSICKRLVELMDGTIGAMSTPGAGSTFWFELPLARVAAKAPSQTTPVPPPPRGPRLSGLRVLGVDDNRLNRFLLERALQLEGASVHVAADGQQALQMLEAYPGFDVVLMDIQMPVMDGLTATRRIRADAALATLPVIALTAGVLAEERAAAQSAGMDEFLAKPLDLEVMVALLQRYAALPQAGGGSAMPAD